MPLALYPRVPALTGGLTACATKRTLRDLASVQ